MKVLSCLMVVLFSAVISFAQIQTPATATSINPLTRAETKEVVKEALNERNAMARRSRSVQRRSATPRGLIQYRPVYTPGPTTIQPSLLTAEDVRSIVKEVVAEQATVGATNTNQSKPAAAAFMPFFLTDGLRDLFFLMFIMGAIAFFLYLVYLAITENNRTAATQTQTIVATMQQIVENQTNSDRFVERDTTPSITNNYTFNSSDWATQNIALDQGMVDVRHEQTPINRPAIKPTDNENPQAETNGHKVRSEV